MLPAAQFRLLLINASFSLRAFYVRRIIHHHLCFATAGENLLYKLQNFTSSRSNFHTSVVMSEAAPFDTKHERRKIEDSIEDKVKQSSSQDMPVEIPNPFETERRVCILCKYGIELDYKNPKLLSQFISPFTGQLYERHITGLCKAQQKKLKETVHLSIRGGYMGAMVKSVEFLKDPLLFDPSNPVRPHKY